MTRYSKGANFERELVKRYKDLGFPIVIRSAGSKGTFDLVAISKEGKVYLVQAKTSRPRKSDVEKLQEMDCPPNCTILIITPEKEMIINARE
ncbi:MAG: hypothetical protein QXQ02_03480 [Halobacteria archaeon]